MPKRVGRNQGLWEQLISEENLLRAINEVNSTHHWHSHHRPNGCTAWVEETKLERVEELRQIITEGFVQKPPKVTRRWDASAQKWRTVSEPAQWPDQYVHHALVQVLQPIFMRGMDFYCCGSIRGRGPHHGRKAIERWMEKDRKGTRYELCGDIYHFYDSLQPEVVMACMKRLIKDRRVLDLIWRTVKDGVMIGAYTSQWFANTVLQPLDQLIRQSGLCKHYIRYMDNLTIFGPNKRSLRRLKDIVEKWLNGHGLRLKGDWQIFPTVKRTEREPLEAPRRGYARPKARMPDAVGYRYGRGYTLPRKRNLLRLKRAIARYRRRRNRGKRINAGAAASILSRCGQLAHCNNVNLYRTLFRGERLVRELKEIVRAKNKEEVLTWNMYLAQRARWKSLKQRATATPT
ncbi:MAG: reverse transcriptase domain-containing protein [Muribaculaceae bacterium]|nr:reverse transcriptase domain-containing protein [Muribaculaceae bacterium]MCM1439321.1 reverse transcriptase domain-containing protein [Roseburia sp.]